MKLEQFRQGVYRPTAHALELSALMAATRWALENGQSDLPEQARQQLADMLDAYDHELADEPPFSSAQA